MLHANQLDKFLELFPNHKIVYDNVQTEIDRHEAEMASRPPGAKFFDYFPTWEEVNVYLDDTIAENQGVARAISVGTTNGGYSIRGLQLGISSPRFFLYSLYHSC
jgi:hypothetical protein